VGLACRWDASGHKAHYIDTNILLNQVKHILSHLPSTWCLHAEVVKRWVCQCHCQCI
jgi:hypothetical protein